MPDNISKLYQELKGTYELGSEEDFRKYLSDGKKREALRKELSADYEVGDSASFTKYLGLDSKPAQQPAQTSPASKPQGTVKQAVNQSPVQNRTGIRALDNILGGGVSRRPQSAPIQHPVVQRPSAKAGGTTGNAPLLPDFGQVYREAFHGKEAPVINPTTGQPIERKSETSDFQRAIQGDEKAAERSGVTTAMKLMKDEMEYAAATGERLKNPIPSLSFVAPTVARDEEGKLQRNASGQVLTGTTSDEQRVAQYQREERDFANQRIINAAVDRLQQQMEADAQAEWSRKNQEINERGLSPELSAGETMGTFLERQRATSPEELLKRLNEAYGYDENGNNATDFANRFLEDNRDAIEEAAGRLGMRVEDYVYDELLPNLSQGIAERFHQNMSEKYSVKDTADYLTRMMGNSMIGTLASMGAWTKKTRQYMQEETQKSREGQGAHYNSDMGTNLVGETLMFAADAAPLMIGGAIGGLTAKGVGRALTAMGKKELGTLVATSSPFLAANVGKAVKYGGLVGGAMARGIGSMGSFMAASGAVQEMSVGDGTLSSIGRAALEGAWEGTKFGATTGIFGVGSHALGSKLSGVGKKAAFMGGSFLVENQIFAGLDYIKDPENFNWAESTEDAFYMQLASKFSSAHGIQGVVNQFKSLFVPKQNAPIRLSDTDKESIQRAFGGMDFTDIASDVNNIGKILGDKQNIPWVTRMKVAAQTMRTSEPSRPRTMQVNMRTNEIREVGENGELIEVHPFKDQNEAFAIRQQIEDRRANDDMLADYGKLTTMHDVQPSQTEIDAIAQEMLANNSGLRPEDVQPGGKSYDMVLDEARSRSNVARQVITQFAQDYGMTEQEVLEIMNKKPIERVDDEPDLMTDLAQRLHDAAYPKGEKHTDQSRIDGQTLAGDEATVNPETSVQVAQEFEEARNAYLNYPVREDVQEGINSLGENVRLDDIYMFVRQNYSGSDVDGFLQVLADYANATAKRDGYVSQTGANIEETVNQEIDRLGFHGTIDDAPDTNNIITFTLDGKKYTLLNGQVGTRTAVQTDPTTGLQSGGPRTIDPDKSGGMIIALGEDGQWVSLKPDALMEITDLIPKEEYGNQRRDELGVAATQALVEAGVVKPEGEGQAEVGPTERDGAELDNAGGEAGADGTGGNEPSAAAPVTTAPAEQPKSAVSIESVTDKDGIKRYENGVSAEDAIADIQADGFDVNEVADASIVEAQQTIDKINAKATKTRKDLVDRKNAQDVVDYYQSLKGRWAEMNQTVEPSDAANGEEIINNPPAAPNVPDNSVPLQPKAAGKHSENAGERRARLFKEAKEEYKEHFNDSDQPDDIHELAAMGLGYGTINWEGEGGLQEHLGKDKKRGIGKKFDSNTFNHYLAPKGEGKTLDQIAHEIAESDLNPMVGDHRKYEASDIRDAILDLIRGAEKPTDIMDYVYNRRLEAAKKSLEAARQQEADAKEAGEKPITLSDEEVSRITNELPFEMPKEGEDIPDAPITKLMKEVDALQKEDGTPSITLVDTDRVSKEQWRKLAEEEYGGAFLDDKDVEDYRRECLEEGVFYNPETGKITVFSGRLTPEELRKRIETIKEYIKNGSKREETIEEKEDSLVADSEVERGEGGAEAGAEGQGQGRAESDGKPDTSERDEYLKPRNDKERQLVSDVEAQLKNEIFAQQFEVGRTKEAYDKKRKAESYRATDLFSDDDTRREEGQLFGFDEMPTDRSVEGVERRAQAEREAWEAAKAKLEQLQSKAEHDSRVRGALDNERRQTSLEIPAAESQGAVKVTPETVSDHIQINNTSQGLHHIFDINGWNRKASDIRTEADGWGEKNGLFYFKKSFKGGRGGDNVTIWFKKKPNKQVRQQIEQWLEKGRRLNETDVLARILNGEKIYEVEPTADPMQAIEDAARLFRQEQDKELGITRVETPEQQAQAAGQQLLTEEPQLTEADIDGTSLSKVMKTYAKAYLKGKTDNELYLEAYLEAKEDVRNRRQNDAADRSDAGSGAQLAVSDDREEQRPGRAGEQAGELASGGDVPGQDKGQPQSGGVQHMEDGKRDLSSPVGERGDNVLPQSKSELDGLSSGGGDLFGGSRSGSNGPDVRRASDGEPGRRVAGQAGERDVKARREDLKNKRDELLARLAEARKKKRLGGDDTLKVQLPVPSIVPTNKEEREIFWELVSNTADYGYTYLEEGLTKFNDWKARVLEDYVEPVKDFFGWGNSEVDRYIEQVWNSDYEIDGVTRTMSEWASFLGEKELKKVVGKTLDEKREAQRAAEGIKVKTGDIDNIRETLPYLLPEQQDDVLKAETQFFDESHQDRQHGNGKGMMFTNGTGTGKTYTGLGIVKRFVKQGKGRVLILTPSQEKVTDWANDGLNLGLQIEKLDDVAKATGTSATKSKGKGVVVTTYANARQNLALLEDCFDLIVYDESHKIMESKEATNTTMMDFHEMLTNKNVERSIDRQTYWLPEWIEHRNLLREREENREKLDLLGKIGELNPEQEELQARLNARMPEIENRLEELRPIMQEIRESKREQAEVDSKRTKTVFLSATPFNVRESLRYAEGYLFSYPEEDKNTIGTYNHRSPEDAFLEQTFPGGYRWRYGRLESHVENAEALGRQEIDFSDYLQNQLGTMSGRMIASDYDYSRDFPVLTLNNAGRFNQAMSEVYRNRKYQPLADIMRQIWNYNDATSLFEAMKTSLVNDRIKEHLNRGQKVVVFHRRRTSREIAYPFARAMEAARAKAAMEQDGQSKQKLLQAVKDFEEDFKDIFEWEKTIDYTLPREQIEKRFGKDKVAFFSGAESKTVKHKSVEEFMKDNGGKDIIIIQEASGKEGISLHDQTGEHQRVEINLALPQSPIAFIQIEGRIYRIGQKSNAIFEYPLLGLDLETSLFAQKFNNALGTTENLALGSKARNLRKSIANSVLENTGEVDYERQGLGGKDMDGRVSESGDKDGFDMSIQDYYGNQKMQRGRDNREGVDYFPTPEPIGYKMVEWGQLVEGETALEPSAGHGAIARYVPETNGLTAIEPSANLFSRLQMRAGGPGRKFEETTFENYALGNKHDVILMNPPYGVGGKTAMEHVAKAFKHLNEGGRIVAIIPDGPAMEKRLDAWLRSAGSEGLNGAAVVTGEVKLPDVAFGRAGTNVRTRVVVIDKISRAEMRKKAPQKVTADLSGETSIGGLFDKIRNVRMPERTIDTVAINEKKAKRTQKVLDENPFTREFSIENGWLTVKSSSRYDVSEIRLNLENPSLDNALITYKSLKETMEAPEKLENGKYVGKSYGRGKDKVPALDAIKDYCRDAIKTLENVTGVTADQMDRMLREKEEERQRREAEREAEIERIRAEREQKKKDAISTFNEAFKDDKNLDKDYIESLIIRAHSNDWSKRDAQNSLRRYGIDWETGKKISSPVMELEKAYNEQMPLDLDTMKKLMMIAETSVNHTRSDAAKRALEMSGIHSDTGEAKEGFDYASHDQYYEKELRELLETAGGHFSKLETKQQKEASASPATEPQSTAGSDYAYKLDKNTRTGEDMHLVAYNGARLSEADYRATERKAKAQGGYYNRFKKAFHFKTEEDARKFMESVNASEGNDGRPQTRFRLREKEAPKKTQKVYKLMRLGEDGKLYPLFIDAAAPTELGKWYDADSPDMRMLKTMPSGTFLVDYAKGTYVSLEDYAKERGIKVGKNPSAELINEATKNRQRWVRISDAGRAQRRYEGESRKYMNIGINGSGQVGEFAMRPGWHAGSLPSMRQIGKGKDRNLRDDRFVWVEGEVPADKDWQAEADRNPDKDIPTHIPEDGYYLKATNANKAASQADRIGWYVAGAFKANRIMSDREARNVITEWNREHPDQPVEYDFERESGREFNAETMQLEDKPVTRFSRRKKKSPETAVPGEKTPFKATRISDDDGAKVINNLDNLAKKSENIASSGKKTFLNDVADAIGAVHQGSGSRYADFETVNGEAVSIRLSNHNATVSGFDYNGRPNGISIVVSRGKNDGIHNDGNAHITEFFYPEKELNKADGQPYAEIVKSLKQALFSGEYKDATGIAKRQEVNADSEIAQTMFRKGGEQNPVEAAYERNRKAGEKLAKRLNMDFEAVSDPSQIKNREVLDAIAAGDEPTGWIEIDEKTGKKKIYMYLPNVRDTYEAEKTIAHETVGHYGLRELLGEKGYKSYMRSLVFDLKTPELSRYIEDHLAENGFDMYRTVDEYLADAAEKGYGDLSMWQKVKDAFTDALRNAGFTMAPSISDVKYMVWLSKHNLEKGNMMDDVRRQALLYRLGKERYEAKVRNGEFTYPEGNTTEHETSAPYFPGEGRTLFRHTPSAKYQKRTYERALNRLGFVWKEAHIDAMQSAVELMRAISGVKKIEDIPSAENFVLLENQMSSKEEQMDFLFNRDYMEPLDKAVSAILPDMGKGVDEQLRNLQLYMIKKHGLERNRYIPIRDAIRDMRKDPSQDQQQVDQLEQDYEQMIEDNRQDLRDGTITLREYFDEIDAWIKHNIDPKYKAGDKDYSGLGDMMGTKGSYDDASVIDDVMSTEAMIGEERINNLWEKTMAVSQFGLDTEYEGGLDSKEKHDKVSKMFEWYVPLRGYDEKTAEEVYDYLEERGGSQRQWAGPVLMNAKGRESLGDVDVFATLGSMSSSAINRALRNQMKQAFARFVRNHYNSGGVEAEDRLVTELPYLWAEKQYDPTTGQEIWAEKFPDIPENAKADDIAQILDQYQQDMKAKESTGDAKRIRQNSSIPYRPASNENKAKHIVDVWINGEKHAFIVNGNPRAALAINGQLKAERNSNILWLSSLSHFMAKVNTSYSPDFIMRNTERDLIYSAANIAVKENAGYWFRWAKNYGVATGRAAFGVPAMHTNLFKRYREGNLNMSNETDRYFKEFMENGGETGWVERKNLDKWKKLIKEGVRKESTPEKVGKAVINALPDAIEAMNERAENLARFATYMTSRQSGRTIVRSISDAKEVSVNFNRKGAGRKTVGLNKQDGSWLNNANAYMAGWSAQNLQDYIMFYNAGVQGMTNMIKNVANHPIKGTTAFAAFALAGMLMPRLNQFLFDEDDDKTGKEPENPYAELPEWVRRNNLCIYSNKGSYITIALPIELRAMYGIGDMAASYLSNPELRSTKNAGVDILTQLNQVAPLDFMGEGAGPLWSVVPSGIRPFAEAAANVNWLGQPIEREEEQWNENKPRWTRAFRNVGDVYVGASKKLNAATNPYGDENIKGWADGALTDPALVEHVVNGYFGGVGSTINRVAQMVKHADEMSGSELITSNWMPIVRTQHYTPNERTRYARTRNKWWYYKEEADKTQETIKTLKKQGEHDPLSFMQSVSEEEGRKGARAKIMEQAYKRYSKIKKKMDKTDDLQEKDLYQLQLDEIMEGAVKELDKIQ